MPEVVVLSGPNGAGKTTAFRTVLQSAFQIDLFVNADMIAQGLNGFNPDVVAREAGRFMLQRLKTLVCQRVSFAFESTLAGRTYAAWLRSIQTDGYRVVLVYYWLESPDLAVARVATRVRRGGHSIPESVIRRRWILSIRNLFGLYLPQADQWMIVNNTRDYQPTVIASGDRSGVRDVFDREAWKKLRGYGES